MTVDNPWLPSTDGANNECSFAIDKESTEMNTELYDVKFLTFLDLFTAWCRRLTFGCSRRSQLREGTRKRNQE